MQSKRSTNKSDAVVEHKSRLRDVFEKRVQIYWRTKSHVDPRFLCDIVKSSRARKNGIVLDLGTGIGIVALAFSQKVGAKGTVIGIDLSSRVLAEARHWGNGSENLNFTASDIENMPFKNESFTVISSRFVLHHLVSPKSMLIEAYRVLKSGGHILIADGVAPELPEADAFLNEIGKARDETHVRYHTAAEISNMIEDAHFTDIQVYRDPIGYPLSLREWVDSAEPSKYPILKKAFKKASKNVKLAFQIAQKKEDISFYVPTIIITGEK